ncbi:hypothetical protein DPMN_173369 [Dreissena polymorpha]|uniref:Uncharacterized protein n=1 Tax=Dreissena polymorpha TaxID=45954 RepID=A0A9D4E5B9_DREPO|nr:hypothetical protein DPMN_173369 [Dreissena polymorpha]
MQRSATLQVCRAHRDPSNNESGSYMTSYRRETDVISCHFDVIYSVNDVTGRVYDTSYMINTLSQASVPSFMYVGQILCLKQRENRYHNKECEPMT